MAENFSEKLVSHLRFIHFSLLTVTTGLLIASTMDPGGAAARAYDDLARLTKLVVQLDDFWLDAYVSEQLRFENPDQDPADPVTLSISTANDGAVWQPRFTVLSQQYYFSPPAIAAGYDVSAELFDPQLTIRGSENEVIGYSVVPRRLPEQTFQHSSLTDLKAMWNLLLITDYVHQVRRVGSESLIVIDLEDSLFREPGRFERTSEWLDYAIDEDFGSPTLEVVSANDATSLNSSLLSERLSFGRVPEYREFVSIIDSYDDRTKMYIPEQIVNSYDAIRWLNFPCQRNDEGACLAVGVPLASSPVPINPLAAMIDAGEEVSARWRDASFSTNFPELDNLTRNIADLATENLLAHLREEVQRAGEQFSAFGLSVPTAALAFWGPVILLVVQLYFAIHFDRFRALGPSTGSIPEFPWFVLYPGLLTVAIAVFTISVYPAGVVSYIIVTVGFGDTLPHRVINATVLTVSSIVAVWSLLNIVKVRRLRAVER